MLEIRDFYFLHTPFSLVDGECALALIVFSSTIEEELFHIDVEHQGKFNNNIQ